MGGYLVSRSNRLWKVAKKVNHRLIRAAPLEQSNLARIWLRAIRLHQWVKNLLLFLVPITAEVFSLSNFITVFSAFIAFSFISSATYLFNDIIDLPHDRAHPSKKTRPLASGDISMLACISMSMILAAGAGALALVAVGHKLLLLLVIYAVASLSYSLFVKKVLVLDALWLAGLYSLRIAAGGIIVGEEISVWLLTFSMFTFFSLAILKRVVEVSALRKSSAALSGRAYLALDAAVLSQVGVASGLVSVLVLALYSREEMVAGLFFGLSPLVLWVPIWLYWVVRIWVLSARGVVNEDPIFFSLRDPISWIVASALLVIALVAS